MFRERLIRERLIYRAEADNIDNKNSIAKSSKVI